MPCAPSAGRSACASTRTCVKFMLRHCLTGEGAPTSRARSQRGGAAQNRLLPPATPQTVPGLAAPLATNGSRISRWAMWVLSPTQPVPGMRRLLLCNLLFQDAWPLPRRIHPDPFGAAEQIASCCCLPDLKLLHQCASMGALIPLL